ncbi:hypothetical protein P175DRAFT_0141237 [Aspergillus ochraceoroseus IBT 24754]|uniref:Uncharacterized protein n=1 Tax=Aspergillus ochraceoroseus IBT 24754 TaxID=1392256 RepID=A0A2T5M2A9_9EURO|nr:uncharacterized protein P175DRAFT_0141237 [Aspergillus ochraceoroseus IBT 24754]PTU22672.1 hypothetical protein P175DRAFT_0141237 [Aspergillus ochraceoroseus IBT 24754]
MWTSGYLVYCDGQTISSSSLYHRLDWRNKSQALGWTRFLVPSAYLLLSESLVHIPLLPSALFPKAPFDFGKLVYLYNQTFCLFSFFFISHVVPVFILVCLIDLCF